VLAHDGGAELPLDGAEGRLGVAALGVVLQVLLAVALEVVERLLEQAPDAPGGVGLEGDVRLAPAGGDPLEVLVGGARPAGAHLADLEVPARVPDQGDELRAVGRVLVEDAGGRDPVRLPAAAEVGLDPGAPAPADAVLPVAPALVAAAREPGRV